jgi:flavin-binding protein dodecin
MPDEYRDKIRSPEMQVLLKTLKMEFYGCNLQRTNHTNVMSNSVYKIIELVGTSTTSWEDAAASAVKKASETLRDLRIAEVSAMDLQLKDGKIESYRTKVKLSFKFEG